ncbi:MAG: CDP-alcohol phosphatidyltransferase family protein [Candidatus Nanopelagicales bacterium]|jgi:cardiolipin synthase
MQQDTPSLRQLGSVPNLVSLSRLLALPVLMFLVIEQSWISALAVAAIFGFTDFLDGFLARRLNQVTPLGALLDPLIDRIFILCLLIAMVISKVLSPILFLLLLSRDLVVLIVNFLRFKSMKVTVIYLGKLGTWVLYVSFALVLLGEMIPNEDISQFAVAGMIWGSILYWLAGYRYIVFTKVGVA